MLNELIALMKDTTLVSVIALNEVAAGRPTTSRPKPSTARRSPSARLMFLVVILPLARLIDKLIARNQGKIARGAHIEVA